MDIIPAKATFDASPTVIGGSFPSRTDLDNLVVFDLQNQLTTDSTIRAGRLDALNLPWPAFANRDFWPERGGWTNSHTRTTELAGTVRHVAVRTKTDISTESTIKDTDGFHAVNISTGTHTTTTENALVAVHFNERVRIVDRKMMFDTIVTVFRDIVFIRQILQQTITCGFAGHAIQRMIRDQQFQAKLAGGAHPGAVGMHN